MSNKNEKNKVNIATAAAANVDGYLRNASKRLRVPIAEGGRGTRRKSTMVTSGTVSNPVAVDAPVADADEWDEVDLGVVKVKKMEEGETVKMDGGVKEDLPVVEHEPVKQEVVDVNEEEDIFQHGVRAPLTGPTNQTGHWNRNDSAYEAMLEEKDLVAAERRSKRIQVTCEKVFDLFTLLLRAKLMWKESQHPLLRKLLLVIRRTGEPLGKGKKQSEFVFFDALRSCKDLLKEPTEPKLTLAPSWVTFDKDPVKNSTSKAIGIILKSINATFELKKSEDDATEDYANCLCPLEKGLLFRLLRGSVETTLPNDEKLELPHPVYFSLIFLSLASACGLSCRLVVSRRVERKRELADPFTEKSVSGKLSIFGAGGEIKKKDRKGLPMSFVWVEVWSSERGCFISVNPCKSCTTLWGSPYAFSVNGDTVADVTPRYISKYSSAYHYNHRLGRASQLSFLWRNIAWDDPREAIDVIVDSFNKLSIKPDDTQSPFVTLQRERERKQIDSLKYSEPIPTTITGIQKHPLFTIESQLNRFEGIFPKDDTTTVGSVKGHMVYKVSAIVNLRSRDGWLRVGRSLIDENTPPYKTVAPPASRPFAQQSAFFGFWQTKPFEPLPLEADGSFPTHGRTSWYILFDKPPPPGIVRLTETNISRVARRMKLDFRHCVTQFVRRRAQEHRRGHWEAVLEGIVVKEGDAPALLKAYKEWVELMAEQEAAKRKERAFRWWLLLSQRLLSMERLQNQYYQGSAFGVLPSA